MNEERDTSEKAFEMRADLKVRGMALFKYDDEPIHAYPYDTPWLDDEEFSSLYRSIRNNTLVDRIRCYSLYSIAQQIRDLPGDVLEVGVWRGGTGGLLTKLLHNKTVFLADTFSGVTKSSVWEHYKDGAHSDTSRDVVEKLLTQDLGVKNYEILSGVFPEDTGDAVTGRQLALVHIDVDVYHSAKDVLEFIWEQITPGGVVVFDDYGFFSACSGIKKLIDEISANKDNLFIHNMNGHAYVIKRS